MYEGYDVERIGLHSESCPAWKKKECTCGLDKKGNIMEYRAIDLEGTWSAHHIERLLNEFAKGGWELITIVHDTLVFGRRKAK